MASFIFVNNAADQNGALVNIAASDADKNSLNLDLSNYKVFDNIADADFENVKLYKKTVKYSSSDTLTYSDNERGSKDSSVLADNVNIIINRIDEFLKNNSSHSMASSLTTYKNLLDGYDFSGITFPTTKSVEEILDDAGETVISRLQIP